jgi:SAM-dependent methyltransferase
MTTIVSSASSNLITHKNLLDTNLLLSDKEANLKEKQNLSLPLAEELHLLHQLAEFELGKFLLENKGLNGYWTSYIIIHGPQNQNLHPLEEWIVHSAPAVKATQERFGIFQKTLQQNLKNNISIASIPCGLMDDLYALDYTQTSNVSLTGIDLDKNSINLAKTKALKNPNIKINFYTQDAWNLGIDNEYDIITSNGLNIYERDDQKVIKLYQEFYNALKPNGILITSFLTPPQAISKESTWKKFNQDDAIKQKAIFSDIIGVSWQAFRTEVQTKLQLETAGFSNIRFIYDSQGMFPTVLAYKQPLRK